MTEPVAPLRRRFVLAGLVSLSALAFTSTAQSASNSIFPFIPDHYTFSTQQVQQAVARKFPLQRTASQIFDVVLSNMPDRRIKFTVNLIQVSNSSK